jgi:hypothetical protein
MERKIPPSLVEVMRKAIVDALIHTNGDRVEAAALLMIGRTTLYRKCIDFEVKPHEYGRVPRKPPQSQGKVSHCQTGQTLQPSC